MKGKKRMELTLDELISRHIEAEGGRLRLASLKSYVTEGIRVQNGKFCRFIEYREAPNKLFAQINDASNSSVFGFDGSVGWIGQTDLGVEEVTGTRLEILKRNAIFLHPFQMHEVYSKMTLRGKVNLKGRDIYVVDAELPSGLPYVLYFDGVTFMLFREDVVINTPNAEEKGHWEFNDFRTVAGIKVAFQRKLTLWDRVVVEDIVTEIKPNLAIDEKKFVMPKPADMAAAQ
jgi:hypothetical protein